MDLKSLHLAVSESISRLDFGSIWPGFEPLRFALYDDENCFFGGKYIEKTDAFFRNDLKIPMSLKEIGVPDDEFFKPMAERAAESCKADSTSPDGSYVKLSAEAIEQILRDSF